MKIEEKKVKRKKTSTCPLNLKKIEEKSEEENFNMSTAPSKMAMDEECKDNTLLHLIAV